MHILVCTLPLRMWMTVKYNILLRGFDNLFVAEQDYLTAVFCPFTLTQTRASLPREWLAGEWSGINERVSGVQHWYSLPSLSLSSLE